MLSSMDFQMPVVRDAAEAQTIVSRIRAIPGVRYAEGDHRTKIFVAQWSQPPARWDDIARALMEMGYTPKYR